MRNGRFALKGGRGGSRGGWEDVGVECGVMTSWGTSVNNKDMGVVLVLLYLTIGPVTGDA